MLTRFRTLALLALVAVLASLGATACDLNPQPLPPGDTSGDASFGAPTAGNPDAGTLAHGGGDADGAGTAPGPGDSGVQTDGGPPEASIGDGGGDHDASDASSDAPSDASDEGG